MAFNALFFAALAAATFAVAVASNVPFGGATATNAYETDVITDAPAPIPTDVGTYASVGSPAGLAGFANGTYAIASSGYADGAVPGTKPETKYGEVTLPQVLGAVSWAVFGGNTSLQLTAAQIWNIYRGNITSWTKIPGSGLTGPIFPVARADEAATTFLVTEWLYQSNTSIPLSQVSDNKWVPGGNITYATGESATVTAAKKTGSIVYATPGSIAGVITEVFVQNYATKAYGKGSTAVLSNSIPATLPARTNTTAWAAVNLLNVNKTNAYAIATFQYLIARTNYSTAPTYNSTKVKAFLNWTQGVTAQNDALNRTFQPLPPAIITTNVAAIKAIL